ncbi:single-stranded DNA-binding protein [Corynebacterium macginleyi]|uniref:Single-stranded DNA-binding protein n=1 Tax=Corynebacterium macginleyi TaxID=38290 RepID=A0A3M0FXM4_9CORY|nr:single-stranded DNA-binding protein [Corynebacterium macginleyi]MBK4136997.1 single-stranded DNA-binding protein [Corynebacterium macginleyi]MBK4148005.1 single-stranded DNA-binding protein [Corynebacterium macginleyi]MBK4153165.1 single-stranded DNA-binding protein [Corynebacterium macginleyi]MBK4157996.1 single-stranded DNA-binding protein [Corynebacterium macginleyi]MBK4158240.1 single-stranded DNA-binding protein [Corynebacterium macginleyi]
MAQGDTNITVVGNIVADPELRFTPAGAAVANFRVASTPRRYNSQTNQWEDGEAMFLTCNVWRQAAENVAETLSKGMRIIVTGRLKQRSFQTREGENRTVFEIDVDEVGPSLKYATAQVNRNPREGGNFSGGGQQQRSNSSNQGGFGGQQQQQNQAPADDPWNSAPPAGGFGGADSEPPF